MQLGKRGLEQFHGGNGRASPFPDDVSPPKKPLKMPCALSALESNRCSATDIRDILPTTAEADSSYHS